MSALNYLLFTTLKNRLKTFVKKPANWVAALLMGGLLGFVIFAGGMEENTVFRPMEEMYAIVSALYIVMFVLFTYQGVNRGATMFTLADIHLMFSAPVKPQKILLYGLVKQMGTSLMVGFFLLFQYAWMHQQYGVPIEFLLLVLLGYGLTLFLGQLTAMVFYSATSAKESARKTIKYALFALCGLAALYVFVPITKNSAAWTQSASASLAQWPMLLFPVGGWMRMLVQGIWTGQLNMLIIGLGTGLLWAGAGIAFLSRDRTDYYEDVLKATEVSSQAIAAKKEGKLQEMLPEHIKVGKTGLNKGTGAAVFYYKHRLESRRAKRFLLDTMTMVMLLVTLGFAFIMRGEGILPAFAFATYMQLFTVATGRWVKELTRPYIYMMPETSFRKLIHCLRESMLGYALEAVLLMVPMGLLVGLPPVEIGAAILVRFTFAALFVAGNLLVERVFSGIRLKMMVLLLYFLVMLLLIAPGVALAIFLTVKGIVLGSVTMTVFAALGVCNLILSPAVLFLCRNVFVHAEWNNQ